MPGLDDMGQQKTASGAQPSVVIVMNVSVEDLLQVRLVPLHQLLQSAVTRLLGLSGRRLLKILLQSMEQYVIVRY